MKPRICLIEDDPIMGEAMRERLGVEGYDCDWFQTAGEAIPALRGMAYTVVVSDIRLPDQSGADLFQQLRGELAVLPPFLFITGHGAIDQAVQLLKLGAEDYLTKPLDIPLLLGKLRELTTRAAPLTSEAGELGISAVMRRIEAMLPRLAAHADTVLITGESGVGKEWLARALHRHFHAGKDTPFIAVNCGAIPETLLESELFGHEKGAFTGAVRTRQGVFEQAHGGTLFLDEIGDMPLAMQVKLLRAIQERTVVHVGGERVIPVDIRLVCATHRDLKEMVERGEFREDLYYRIHIMHVPVPPLRERKEDILWLATRMLDELQRSKGFPPRVLDPLSERTLTDYPWPGNVRELRHALERAGILNPQGPLTPELLFGDFALQLAPECNDASCTPERLTDYLAHCERAYITQMLEQNAWRIVDTAGQLGISRKALWDKMRRLGVEQPGEA